MDVYIGTIMMFGFTFPPQGWALCQGQLLSIQQNTALFALLGTTYGGNGTTTFGLPDYQGRVPVGMGTGAGLSSINQGEKSGQENVTLLVTNMPAHNHPASGTVAVTTSNATSEEPAGNILAAQNNNLFAAANTANGNMGGVTVQTSNAGGSQPFNIRNPYLGTNFSIALEGIFPSRN
jgi:microcystin-dependent protein